jgi:hypothetical protein
MADPSLALQKAIVARLKATAGVVSLVSTRIYDRAPQGVQFPFVQIGNFEILDDSNECHDAFECRIEVNVWSREVGQEQAKALASAAHSALHRYSPDLSADDFAMVGEIEHENSRAVGDGDGITTRIIVSFLAMVEKT